MTSAEVMGSLSVGWSEDEIWQFNGEVPGLPTDLGRPGDAVTRVVPMLPSASVLPASVLPSLTAEADTLPCLRLSLGLWMKNIDFFPFFRAAGTA